MSCSMGLPKDMLSQNLAVYHGPSSLLEFFGNTPVSNPYC